MAVGMRRMAELSLAILLGAICAWGQMRGVGARPATGGFGAGTSAAHPSTGEFRGGATFARPQTAMPQTLRPMQPGRNFSSGTRNLGSFHNGGRYRSNGASGLSRFFSRTYNSTVFFPPFYSIGWGYPFYPSYYSPNSPYLNLMGGYPYAGGYGYPRSYGDPNGPGAAQNEPNNSADETPWVQGHPPRADALDEASAFHRPDPRTVLVTLDGVNVLVPEDGGPLIIGSGNHTLRLTTQSADSAKDNKAVPSTPQKKPAD